MLAPISIGTRTTNDFGRRPDGRTEGQLGRRGGGNADS